MKLVDRPDHRKLHERPVALLGGLSVLTSFAAVILCRSASIAHDPTWIAGAAGAMLLTGIGLWDDLRSLPPIAKLGTQIIAAAGLVVTISRPSPTSWVWIAAACFWLVALSNAYNLVDNMDGLAAGVGAIAAAGLAILAPQPAAGHVAAALAGALIGFAPFNWHPARVFLGDAGALPIGFLLGALALTIARTGGPVMAVSAAVVLAVPIFDTTLVTVSRLRRHLNPFTSPGTDHLSHRLVALGLTIRQATVAVWFIALVCAFLSIILSNTTLPTTLALATLLAILGGTALVYLEKSAPVGLQPSHPSAVLDNRS